MDFATKLKCYRRMLNVTQNSIADAMGVTRSTYTYYETGRTLPTPEGIRILASFFSIPVEYLMESEPSKEFQVNSNTMLLHDPNLPFHANEGKLATDTFEYDPTFASLTPDEKELVIRYRLLKASKKHKKAQSDNDYIMTSILSEFMESESI